MSPDCKTGKHTACTGAGWDEATDTPCPCPCYCHRPPADTGVEDWRSRAACRDEDPELFFPPGYGDAYARQIAAAKAVCDRCDVRAECLERTMAAERNAGPLARYGIAGGKDPAERATLNRARRRAREVIAP